MHKARHAEARGASLTQWDREWEPRRTDATAQRNNKRHLLYLEAGNNTPTWNSAPPFPSAIVSPAGGVGAKGVAGDGGAPRQTFFSFFFFAQPSALHQKKKNPPFVFVPRLRRFSWESLTDSSLCAALLCDSYHTGPRILGAAPPHLPLIQGDENTHSPPSPPSPPACRPPTHTDASFATPRTSGGETNIIKKWNAEKKRGGERQSWRTRGEGRLEKFTVAKKWAACCVPPPDSGQGQLIGIDPLPLNGKGEVWQTL